jgi:1-aminocyclopropane-1-carboxylate deaminase
MNLGNIQITNLIGAEHAPNDSDKDHVITELEVNGETPYWIPSGASAHPLGGCGYARFAFEIAEQEREMGMHFDTIILPCASGSTLGGAIAGFAMLFKSTDTQKERRVIGIDTFAYTAEESAANVLKIARTTARQIGLQESDITVEDILVDDRWNAGRYGFVDDSTGAAIKLLAQLEGILVDPVYTGKAFTGLLGKAALGEFQGCQNILFVHTGGVSALSAYPKMR